MICLWLLSLVTKTGFAKGHPKKGLTRATQPPSKRVFYHSIIKSNFLLWSFWRWQGPKACSTTKRRNVGSFFCSERDETQKHPIRHYWSACLGANCSDGLWWFAVDDLPHHLSRVIQVGIRRKIYLIFNFIYGLDIKWFDGR